MPTTSDGKLNSKLVIVMDIHTNASMCNQM
jgi:hypothetical protein